MEGQGEGQRGSCDNHHHLIMSEDVLIQILLCLPVKSLLRFKSVCKSWRSIIQSTFFINLHATKLGGGISVLFNRGEEHKEKKGDNLFTLSGKEFEVVEDLGRPPLVDLGDELDEEVLKNIRFEVLDCCNGIICLHYFAEYIILWNPAIKQSRVVPKPSNLLRNPNDNDNDNLSFAEDVIAFGVDIKTKDYKVLLITTLEPYLSYYGTDSDDDDDDDDDEEHSHSPYERRVHVYSSSTDSWRCIDDTLSAAHPNRLEMDRYAIGGRLYLNGSHFFTASCQSKVEDNFCTKPLLMSFDFTEEIFRTIQPPFYWSRNKKNANTNVAYFIPFDEKIALVDAKANSLHRFECDVWILLNEQHNGVKESWTKLYTFEHSCRFYPSDTALRCIVNNGEFAIVYCLFPGQRTVWKLQLLNLITGETKCLRQSCRQGCQVDLKVNIYKPSLVQIGRSGATTNEKCN